MKYQHFLNTFFAISNVALIVAVAYLFVQNQHLHADLTLLHNTADNLYEHLELVYGHLEHQLDSLIDLQNHIKNLYSLS